VEELLFILPELVGEFIAELVIGLLWEGVGEAFHWNRNSNRILSVLGWGLIGAATGAVSLLLFPNPLLRHTRFHGLSLIAAPLATGVVMKLLGDRLRSRGKQTTSLMTFWGGSIFALAFALVRFWWLFRA